MSGEARFSFFFLGVIGVFGLALLSKGIWPFAFGTIALNAALFMSGWILIAITHCLPELVRERPDYPIRHLWKTELGPEYRRRFNQSWPILAVSILFFSIFSMMKSAIPLFNDFSWDARFIAWDHYLHGKDPWRILQPFVGYPLITSLLSVAYHTWILLIYVGTIYFALYVTDRRLRLRFFISSFGIWTINGVVLAIIFSSVGPCFVGPLLGNDHYAAQMTYLRQANESFPILVLPVQQLLLDWQLHGSHGLGRGITAMPSMHVALAFLFFLAVRQISHRLGLCFLVFLLIIMIGSVHLAYHYAIDAYASLFVTFLVWTASSVAMRGIESEGGAAKPPSAAATAKCGATE
ncbi:phosphatase PAP2 family protein [Sphingopyxis indica]|uniref:phosphatase PAP2 family protein n=1 Tax=Sphingopyxis indica TaxID=436663 RepID=UPI002938D9CC|nr:phosphatase PAP2 family protein [Sphingopyxis indica]WOF43826.1 phosphatase PAP2 family protein [Sphingopyxis indica]